MKTVIVLTIITMIASVSIACDSFEDCMNPDNRFYGWDDCYDALCRQKYDCPAGINNCARLAPCEECSDYSFMERENRPLRAIAFKLDEISKKLNK